MQHIKNIYRYCSIQNIQKDEMQRAEEKTRVNTAKLAEFERQHDEHEAGRKAAEVRCQENI